MFTHHLIHRSKKLSHITLTSSYLPTCTPLVVDTSNFSFFFYFHVEPPVTSAMFLSYSSCYISLWMSLSSFFESTYKLRNTDCSTFVESPLPSCWLLEITLLMCHKSREWWWLICQPPKHFLSLVIGVPSFVYNFHLVFVDNVCFPRSMWLQMCSLWKVNWILGCKNILQTSMLANYNTRSFYIWNMSMIYKMNFKTFSIVILLAQCNPFVEH